MCRAIKFKDWDCCISIAFYATKDNNGNNRIALQLNDANEGDPVAVATINIPEEPLAEDEVIIKDYSENEGMLSTLFEAGIVSTPVRFVQSGYTMNPICKLLIK